MQQHLLTSHIHELNNPAMCEYFNSRLITQHNSYDMQSTSLGNTIFYGSEIAYSLQ